MPPTGPPTGRIVFEAKDKKLSKNDAWQELNEAMAARAASFAVLVVAGEERVPSSRETLTEYEGNKLIVAVDREEPDGLALEVAYRLAAARVAMARDRDLTVDAPAVRDAAEEAVTCLRQAQAVRAALTGIKTSSDRPAPISMRWSRRSGRGWSGSNRWSSPSRSPRNRRSCSGFRLEPWVTVGFPSESTTGFGRQMRTSLTLLVLGVAALLLRLATL